jgi:hypothetical protein
MNDFATSIPDVDNDPVMRLLLQGQAATVSEAEEMVLQAHLPEILRLIESCLTEDEFLNQPLVQILLAHGSRAWEDALR